ncbi:MAG: YebC/PmpR family DNA-binding transcriptional regulator [Myxococcota bacterium]|nr:YebC/PmpR family DNA-binding transcriptional regulator [Myxococcota bacterium]
MGRKSAKIAAKKGAQDKLRSQVYTKMLFEVTRAVKTGGDDPKTNFLLRVALGKCKKNNVPKDNIDRAIKKGMGGDGDGYSDVYYEGYGCGGVGVFVETSTNNVARTVANIRYCFSRNGGTLENSGTLRFLFTRKAIFEIKKESLDEDEFMLEMIDAGAEEIEPEDDLFVVTAEKEDFGSIQKKLEEMGIVPEDASLERIPSAYKKLSGEKFEQFQRMIEALEADEDVIRVFHNLEYD